MTSAFFVYSVPHVEVCQDHLSATYQDVVVDDECDPWIYWSYLVFAKEAVVVAAFIAMDPRLDPSPKAWNNLASSFINLFPAEPRGGMNRFGLQWITASYAAVICL